MTQFDDIASPENVIMGKKIVLSANIASLTVAKTEYWGKKIRYDRKRPVISFEWNG